MLRSSSPWICTSTKLPVLDVNGRPVPANAPYDVLKKIIEYQEKLDGIAQ